MKLEKTKELINSEIDASDPKGSLVKVLRSAIELLSLPDNDFCWSSWENYDEALKEIESLIKSIKAGALPERLDVAVLFAPTGPIQEVSLSSGWGEAFLRVAEKYDDVEKLLW